MMNGLRNSERVIGGVRIAYGEAGAGSPLFLIHGLGGPLTWGSVVDKLSSRFRVIVPQLPGFGNSGSPGHALTTEEYADVVGKLMDELAPGPAGIAGISYGGEVSAYVASRFRDRVSGLILVGASGFNITPWIARNDIRWMIFAAAAKHVFLRSRIFVSMSGARAFLHIRNRPQALVEHTHQFLAGADNREALLNCLRNAVSHNADYPRVLGSISAKTLILWGREDRIVPVGDAGRFHNSIPGSALSIFEDCGHAIPFERPEEMFRAMSAFLHP